MSTKPKKQPGGSPCNNLKLNAGPHEHGQRDGERGLDLEGLPLLGAPLHSLDRSQEGETINAMFKNFIWQPRKHSTVQHIFFYGKP